MSAVEAHWCYQWTNSRILTVVAKAARLPAYHPGEVVEAEPSALEF